MFVVMQNPFSSLDKNMRIVEGPYHYARQFIGDCIHWLREDTTAQFFDAEIFTESVNSLLI